MPTKRFDSLDPERKARLLAAAAEEFAAHGFEAASFNRIIERADTSKGAIYYYFEDKADLYATVLRDAIGRLIVACGTLEPFDDVEGFWREVEQLGVRAIRHYRGDPHIAGLVRTLVRDGMASGTVTELRATSAEWFGALLVAGQAIGAVRTDLPVSLMLAIGTAVSEGFDLWLVEHVDELDDPAITRLAATITDLYRRMAVPAPREAT